MVVAGEILKECNSGGEEEWRDKCRTKKRFRAVFFVQLKRRLQRLRPVRVWRRFWLAGACARRLVLSRWSNLVSHSHTVSPSSILICDIQGCLRPSYLNRRCRRLAFQNLVVGRRSPRPRLSPAFAINFHSLLWRLNGKRQK